MSQLTDFTDQLREKKHLTSMQAEQAFMHIMSGEASDAEMAAFLLALKDKGETINEITAAARIMRDKMTRFDAPDDAIDVCGTGGDSKGSYNISTTVALVVAACGIPVAKHGNRSVSSKSGSSDVLSALGVNIDANSDTLSRCLEKANICFLMAPNFHPAAKHVAPVRKQLATRTIFNLLGPLCNPAEVRYQLLGVYDDAWCQPVAHVLQALDSVRSWVVHGADGMDELTLCDRSFVCKLHGEAITEHTVTPEDAGLSRAQPNDLAGGDSSENAKALHGVLNGEHSAYRDAVLLNAAAALIVADKADDLPTGVALAAEAITSGRAADTLKTLIEVSNAS